jgi:hypothetical protein
VTTLAQIGCESCDDANNGGGIAEVQPLILSLIFLISQTICFLLLTIMQRYQWLHYFCCLEKNSFHYQLKTPPKIETLKYF